MSKSPKPDEYGRLRVVDQDTGHERSIHEAEFAHGNYEIADSPASTDGGDVVPPVLARQRSKAPPKPATKKTAAPRKRAAAKKTASKSPAPDAPAPVETTSTTRGQQAGIVKEQDNG